MKYIINKEQEGKAIKDFLKSNGFSHSLLKQLKKLPDGITVNGLHQNVIYTLKSGDILELNIGDTKEDENEFLEPVNLPIEIIFENENITIVNKPYGMPTHESTNNRGNTLANALAYRYRDKPYVFRATNRLDKDTSGVVITANNKLYSAILSDKIKSGKVQKSYVAVIEGYLTGNGVIEAPIDRLEKSIIKRGVMKDGEYALTEYTSLCANEKYSVVLVTPKTGRTHQIRVHMAHIGHPLAGDTLYGGSDKEINRQALHCLKMGVEGIGEFYAPLAPDMKELIRRIFGNEEFIPKN